MSRARTWGAPLLLLAVVAATTLGLFLSIHRWRGVSGPIGWDSTQYTWRTTLAQRVGIGDAPARLPSEIRVKQGRPAFPVVASALSPTTGASVLELAGALPVAAAGGVALAAVGLVASSFALRGRTLAAIGFVVGVSPNTVLMLQYAYIDNLLVCLVFLAALTAAVAAAEGARPVWPAIALTAASALVHSSFFLVALGVLTIGALALAPGSLRDRRASGTPLLTTPAGRLALVGGGSVLAAAGAYLVLAGTRRPSPILDRATFEEKLRNDLPDHRLPFTLPFAAVGAWLARKAPGRAGARRPVLATLLVAWVAVAIGGLILHAVTPLAVPANRLLVFGLGLPLLVGLAVGLGAERLGGVRAWLVPVLLALAVAGAGGLALRQWFGTSQQSDPRKLREAAWAAAYLDAAGVATDRPVVVLVDERGADPSLATALLADHVLAAMPEARIDDVYPFLGRPEDYLARRPTVVRGHERFNRTSARLLDRLRHTYARDPVAVLLPSFSPRDTERWRADRPERTAGLGAVVAGPVRRAPAAAPELRMPEGSLRYVSIVLVVLLALGLLGLGWSAWLFRGAPPLTILGLAPAIGVAALVVVGLAADRVGIRLGGAGGPGVVIATLAGGVAAGLAARRTAGDRS